MQFIEQLGKVTVPQGNERLSNAQVALELLHKAMETVEEAGQWIAQLVAH